MDFYHVRVANDVFTVGEGWYVDQVVPSPSTDKIVVVIRNPHAYTNNTFVVPSSSEDHWRHMQELENQLRALPWCALNLYPYHDHDQHANHHIRVGPTIYHVPQGAILKKLTCSSTSLSLKIGTNQIDIKTDTSAEATTAMNQIMTSLQALPWACVRLLSATRVDAPLPAPAHHLDVDGTVFLIPHKAILWRITPSRLTGGRARLEVHFRAPDKTVHQVGVDSTRPDMPRLVVRVMEQLAKLPWQAVNVVTTVDKKYQLTS